MPPRALVPCAFWTPLAPPPSSSYFRILHPRRSSLRLSPPASSRAMRSPPATITERRSERGTTRVGRPSRRARAAAAPPRVPHHGARPSPRVAHARLRAVEAGVHQIAIAVCHPKAGTLAPSRHLRRQRRRRGRTTCMDPPVRGWPGRGTAGTPAQSFDHSNGTALPGSPPVSRPDGAAIVATLWANSRPLSDTNGRRTRRTACRWASTPARVTTPASSNSSGSVQ